MKLRLVPRGLKRASSMHFFIDEFMTTGLGLAKTELLVYALIYSFSQKQKGCYWGSISYTATLLNCTSQSVLNAFKSLTEKGLVKQVGSNPDFKTNQYVAIVPDGICAEILGGSKNLGGDTQKICDKGVKKLDPIENSNIKNRDNIIPPYNSPLFISTWVKLIHQPNWKNKTAEALEMACKKLGKVSEADAIKMMENTIEGGWQGLFPLRKEQNATPSGQMPHESAMDYMVRQGIERGFFKPTNYGTDEQ